MPIAPQELGSGASYSVGHWALLRQYGEMPVPMPRFPARAFALALAVVGLGALAAPAASRAHIEARPPSIRSGETQALTLSVPNERADTQMARLEVTAPPGVDLEDASGPPGWQARASGSRAAWDGSLPPETTVSLTLTAHTDAEPGPLTLGAVQRFEDGTSAQWDVSLTILPAGDASPRMRLGRAAVGAFAGLVLLGASLLTLRARRRPLQDR